MRCFFKLDMITANRHFPARNLRLRTKYDCEKTDEDRNKTNQQHALLTTQAENYFV